MGSQTERRFPRVYIDQPATMVLQGWYWDHHPKINTIIYQLGATGCGLVCNDTTFEKGQRIYMHVPADDGGKDLCIGARIAWKDVRPDLLGCQYGIEFMWIRKDPGDEVTDPVTEMLNAALRPTGFSLLAA